MESRFEDPTNANPPSRERFDERSTVWGIGDSKVNRGDPRASRPLHCNRAFLYESSRKLTGQLGCQPTDLCLCILAPESAKTTKNEGRHTLTRRTDRLIFRHPCDQPPGPDGNRNARVIT